MPKLTLRTLLSLIIQAKKVGSGKLGNGRMLVQFLLTFADPDGTERSDERNILRKFCNDAMLADAYKSVNRRIDRFLREGKGYPYDKFTFTQYERNMGDLSLYRLHLAKMSEVYAQVLDETKIEPLVHTLLEILRQDDDIQNIPYGCGFLPKSALFGTFAHQKKICLEALLLGLFYLTHRDFLQDFGENLSLLPLPEKLPFHVVRYEKRCFSTNSHEDLENLLHLDHPLSLRENLHENAKRPYAVTEVRTAEFSASTRIYPLEYRNAGGMKNALPKEGNVFVYGTGGVGKTTILLEEIRRNAKSDTVYFLLPLQKFQVQNILNFQPLQSNWILLQILLKYHYQYEFHTLAACIAAEGEAVILQHLSQLHELLSVCPKGWKPRYTVALDGFNELSVDLQIELLQELEHSLTEWNNVRFIITGRAVPQHKLFQNFEKIKVLGITQEGLSAVLEEFPDLQSNPRIMELLRIPLFLRIRITQNKEELCSRGKLLDAYMAGFSGSEEMQFAVQYILPFAAKKMAEHRGFIMDRADLSEAVRQAFAIFVKDDRVFQNCLAPRGFHKKALQTCRERFVELILEEICFLLKSGENSPEIWFSHQYFRDYFAARCIVNLIEALDAGYGNHFIEDEAKMFRKFGLGHIWFPDKETEIYRMIGEIVGDDRNRFHEEFWYEETLLDGLLAKRYDTFRLTENIIRTMAAARDNLICGADFSGTSLPLHLPCGIKFSSNGKEPCNFSGCRVHDIGFFDSELECVAASQNEQKLLLRSEDGYGLLWDAKRHVVLSEYWDNFPFNMTDMVYYEDAVPIEDESIKVEIAAQLTHFMGCDFRGARFLFDHTKEMLRGMGAIVDD